MNEFNFWLNESNVRSNKHTFTFYYSLISLTRWYCVHVLRFNIYEKNCNIHYNVFFHWFSMDYLIYNGFFSTKIDTMEYVVKFNIIFETWFINNHIPELKNILRIIGNQNKTKWIKKIAAANLKLINPFNDGNLDENTVFKHTM